MARPLKPWVTCGSMTWAGGGAGLPGHAAPGFSGEFGIGAGYALDQRWVLALDVLDNYANATRVSADTRKTLLSR